MARCDEGYRCEACGQPFAERRIIDLRDSGVVCPACAATKVVRLVSAFAARMVRATTHMNVDAEQCRYAADVLAPVLTPLAAWARRCDCRLSSKPRSAAIFGLRLLSVMPDQASPARLPQQLLSQVEAHPLAEPRILPNPLTHRRPSPNPEAVLG